MDKVAVLNSISMVNTVGQELYEIFLAQDKDIGLMEIENVQERKRLSKTEMLRATRILEFDSFFVDFLSSFQDEYKQEEIKSEEQYRISMSIYRQVKRVLPVLPSDFCTGFDVLDDIREFFGAESEQDILKQCEDKVAMFHSPHNTKIDNISLCGWLRRGEIEFDKSKNTLHSYDKVNLLKWLDSYEWEKNISNVNYFKTLPNIFNRFGVCLVLLPFLSNTVYGAIQWKEGFPIVMVSDRDQDLATCWFTLFHELGHVILHEKQLTIEGEINKSEPKYKKDKRETEANKFANHYLFKGDDLRKYIFTLKRNKDYETQSQISTQFNVNPLFVGYWMKKAQYFPTQKTNIPITFGNR